LMMIRGAAASKPTLPWYLMVSPTCVSLPMAYALASFSKITIFWFCQFCRLLN
jgi:hypothetical protein